MAQKTPAILEGVHSVGETSVEKFSFSFLWVINNFSVLKQHPEVKSPVFRGAYENPHGWQLSMYPLLMFDGVEYCSFYLSMVDFGKVQDCQLPPGPVRVTFQISMLNADGRPVVESEDTSRVFNDSCPVWGCPNFVTRSSLVNSAGRLVVNDTIRIHCNVVVFGVKQKMSKSSLSHGTPSAKERNASFRNSFARDFGRMFRESIGTDVTILSGKFTFQAHTFLLKARSPVFAAMFSTDMIEKETKTLVISDFDDVVVKGMLEYLYTGKTECMAELAPELLQIAEKYDLTELKEDCGYALAESLSHENAAAICVLANTYNVPFLVQRAQDYIFLTEFQVTQSSSFIKMKVHSASDDFADLFLSQLFIEAGHVLESVLPRFC